jgi:amino acid adenylation domain-containing protein
VTTVDAKLSAAKRELLERRLRKAAGATVAGISRRAGDEPVPLSYAQERLWFMEQFAPGTAAYGDPLLVALGGDFDAEAFRAALVDLTARHESLRMRFPAAGDGVPAVVVDDPHEVPLPVTEVADRAGLDAAVAAASVRPFDLSNGPLLRADLLRVGGGAEHFALVDMHHIVTDGWSNETVLSDLAELYRARRAGEEPRLAPPPVGYGDFARWQRDQLDGAAVEGTPIRRHLDYWLERLPGVPALDLPTDAPRPPTQTFDGASHHFRVDSALTEDLTELGREHRATLFMTVLAAYQALLTRYTGQHDFAVGSPVAGRSHPDLDRTVGMFVNMLPIRADLAGDPSGHELVDRVRQAVLGALEHQDVPFEKVVNELKVARDISRSAVFQVMFVLQNYEFQAAPRMVDEKTEMGWSPVELPATRFDLELHAYTAFDRGLQCRFVYNTALFAPESIARMQRQFSALLRDLVARPDAPIGELSTWSDAEREELAAWNATGAPREEGATLPGLIAAQVSRTPDAVAVADEDGSLTYRQLDAAADRIARRLRAAGAGPESVVAVCVERSVALVTALLATLKTGAAYLPLDPEHPADRLAYTLEDSGARIVLAQRRLTDRLPAGTAGLIHLDDLASSGDASSADAASGDHRGGLREDGAAYLIYTSGSTGRPKGVVNTHRGIVNRLAWMQDAFGLGTDDVVLQKTPAGFDVSVWEFFWPLCQGATLVLARPGGHRDPAYLREVIALHGVTTVHFVPSMLEAFLDDAGEPGAHQRCATLRRVVCSGEELPVAVARRCVEAMPWASLHNLYGPTEAAVDVTAWDCTPQDLARVGRVPIGTPVHNTRIHVLDDLLREVPAGAAGQLHIGGVQVARGYHRRPALTAEKFVPDPFGPPGARLYATGDLARRRPDGAIEFLGRIDGQVKLRGLRIELGEIEAVLREQPGVRAAAVAVKEPSPGDRRIVGYLVADEEPDPAALRSALGTRLPDYMVPAAFLRVDGLPYSPNGKLDRAALPVPEFRGVSSQAYAAPESELETAIAELWSQLLGVPSVGLDDDFFALGGHSLLATQLVARMRAITETRGRRAGVMDLFQNPTVRGLAAFVEADGGDAPRHLLYELTKPIAVERRRSSYVCVPYGGGSAAVYQPIADALPAGYSLYSVAIPGHDVGLDEEPLPFDALARRCADEVLERVAGPLVLYGHCGVGGALIIEVARLLEAAGRELDAVYVGGIFPFARPRGLLSRFHTWLEDLSSNRSHVNWLTSMGVDMQDIDPDHVERIVSNMRQDSRNAEDHFTELLDSRPARLRAPIISVVGERDPVTDFYQERYREWQFLADTVAVVVLDEAGHFFLRYRAEELVEIITSTHLRLAQPAAPPGDAERPRWWLEEVSGAPDAGVAADRGMRRFLTVAAGQLVSTVGSSLTGFAIPVWIYTRTGSLGWFGLTGVLAVIPMLLVMPVAGALADRADRRRLLMVVGAVAGLTELALFGALRTGHTALPFVYPAMILIVCSVAVQRVAFTAAIPQLAPKRYLGHANGITQTINGAGVLFAPLLAVGLFAAIGLGGILVIDVVSYAFALTVLAAVRFPGLMGRVRREAFWAQVLGGVRLSWGVRSFRAMLLFFAVGNLLYAPAILLVTPLVLGFAHLAQVGVAAVADGLGALVGGLVLTVWGGPARRRMIMVMALIGVSGAFVMITGVRPNLAVVLVGLFGTAVALSIANGIYVTIIQVKIPQRFHGRVIALNQTIAWSTIPIGFAVFVPASGPLLDPLMARHGALAGTLGRAIGTGSGRGIGLAYLLFGLAMVVNALIGLRLRALRQLDTDLPDAAPDDLIGVQALDGRDGPRPGPAHVQDPAAGHELVSAQERGKSADD